MYRPEPPTFDKPRKCERDGCVLFAEYESLTVKSERHYTCEQHWKELLNRVQVVSWKRISQ